jgi:protocatechuate 3,4-dioxygenase beta subunit
MRIATAFAVLLLAFGCSGTTYTSLEEDPACGGPSGAIVGIVKARGKPVEGAVVELWHESSDTGLAATTDSSGQFSFTCITPEWYSIAVESPGKTWPREVRVRRRQETRITLSM